MVVIEKDKIEKRFKQRYLTMSEIANLFILLYEQHEIFNRYFIYVTSHN